MKWQQREFALHHDELTGRIELSYVSEKINGDRICAATLVAKKGSKPAKLKELSSILLTNLTDELRSECATQIYYYDKALYNKQGRYRSPAEYEVEVPSQLHPILISWRDTVQDGGKKK